MVLCLFIFLGWMWLSQKIWPPPPPAPPKKPDAAVQAPKPPPDKPDVHPPTPPPDGVKTAEPTRYPEKPPFVLRSKAMDVTLSRFWRLCAVRNDGLEMLNMTPRTRIAPRIIAS